MCDQESAKTHAHRKSYQCLGSKRLSRHAKRFTEVPGGEACVSERKHWPSRGLQSHSEERVSKQTKVPIHDSNRAEVILNPEDIRVVPQGVFYLCTTSRQDLKAPRVNYVEAKVSNGNSKKKQVR